MFQYEMIDLPKIAIIGKEGLCTKEKNVVQDLWQQANSNFSDIAVLGMKNADGSYVGFLPWTDDFSRGLYLAGVEVYEDTPVPDGWVKWVMPARKYLVTEVTPESCGWVFLCTVQGDGGPEMTRMVIHRRIRVPLFPAMRGRTI